MQRIRFLVAIGVALLSPVVAEAQHPPHRHAVHVEALGPALLGSVNYEYRLLDHASLRAGVGYLPQMLENHARVLSPLLANAILGRGTHRLELGAGAVLVYLPRHTRAAQEGIDGRAHWGEVEWTGTAAYRYEHPRSGAIYRLGLTPLLRGEEFYPLFALSAGLGF